MSKKTKGSRRAGARKRSQPSDEAAEQNETHAKRDAERYGDVLFSATYDITEKLAKQAAVLYGAPRLSDAAIVMLVVGLVGLVVTLATPYHDVFVMLVSLIFAVTGSTATRNWPNIQAWALMGTNIGESQTDVHRHVVVTSDEVVVEGPGAEVARYPLLQLKRARHDENGCLASFGRGRVAYFPARVMSASKLRELVQMFEGAC